MTPIVLGASAWHVAATGRGLLTPVTIDPSALQGGVVGLVLGGIAGLGILAVRTSRATRSRADDDEAGDD